MGRAKETFGKKENVKKKTLKKQDKEHRREVRKSNSAKGGGLETMMAYIDENGNISATPPDPKRVKVIKTSDIMISIPKHVELDAEDLLRTGTVTFFNHAKGYGFIKDAKTQESVFVHSNNVNGILNDNDQVTFEVEDGLKGTVAVKVQKKAP